jgi:hypothetical protein
LNDCVTFRGTGAEDFAATATGDHDGFGPDPVDTMANERIMPRNGSSHSLVFSGVQLENWRNFVRADLRLQKRVFLVGPNASGKSNFLDVFRFLHDLVSVGGGFQEAVERRGGMSSIRTLAGRSSDVLIRVDISSDGAEVPGWRYELGFGQGRQRLPVIKREAAYRNGVPVFDPRPDADDRRDPERLKQTYLQQTNVNEPFREIAQFFASVEYVHVAPQLVRDAERYGGHEGDPFGGDLLEQIVAMPKMKRDPRLRRIEEALRLAVPQLTGIATDRDAKGRPHGEHLEACPEPKKRLLRLA